MSKINKTEGAILWVVLGLGALIGLFSLLTWPFRALIRRLPGRREKLLQPAIDELRQDIAAARQLLEALRPGDAKAMAELERRIHKTEQQIATTVERQGWPEDLEGDGPGVTAFGLLEDAGLVQGMDWRSSPEDLQQTLKPLLRRRGITIDWGFVRALEAQGKGEALRNPVFLPVVGDHVEKTGFILAQVIEGSDAYHFLLCTPDEFARIDQLSCRSFTIRRVCSATGPVPEP
jgi:hypothetical protein